MYLIKDRFGNGETNASINFVISTLKTVLKFFNKIQKNLLEGIRYYGNKLFFPLQKGS